LARRRLGETRRQRRSPRDHQRRSPTPEFQNLDDGVPDDGSDQAAKAGLDEDDDI
jgi:hypothetical protein